MRVLVLCGDYWHPASVVKDGLAPLRDDFQFEFVESMADWTPEKWINFQ